MARVDLFFKGENKKVAESMFAEGVIEKALRAFVTANRGVTAHSYKVRLEGRKRGFQLRVTAFNGTSPRWRRSGWHGRKPSLQMLEAKNYQRENPTASRTELMRRFGIHRSTAWQVRHELRQEGIAVPLRGVRK